MVGPSPAGGPKRAPAARGRCRGAPSAARARRRTDHRRPGRGDPFPSRISPGARRGGRRGGEPLRPRRKGRQAGGPPARRGRPPRHPSRVGNRAHSRSGTIGRALRRSGARRGHQAGPGAERHRDRGRMGATKAPRPPDRSPPGRCGGHHRGRGPRRARGEGDSVRGEPPWAGPVPFARHRAAGRGGRGARAMGPRHARHLGRARGSGPTARRSEPSEGGDRGGAAALGARPPSDRSVTGRATRDRLLRRRLRATRGARTERSHSGGARRALGRRNAPPDRPGRSGARCLAPFRRSGGPDASRGLGAIRPRARSRPTWGFPPCDSVPCVTVADGVMDSRILHVTLK